MIRGMIQNKRVEISNDEAQRFLKMGKVAHVATVDEEGYPYVIPFVYVYEGNDKLYLHIGNIRESHFWSNIKQNPKISIEVSEMGDLHPGKKYACQSALVYQSVVLFGQVVRIEEESRKEWFFDALLEKYGNPEWTFEKEGYPIMPKIELFEVQIEKLTGKINYGMYH
ncbi:pyridoxamine 5'-phosphate oxidase family protein [Lysinibacillus fusiformis]|uniref:pyridoxamine 5'-phosphate oxidase family protein n=1 Tax=Lysinibacillus fusiformis TaxID=28031 RepID=UPI00263A4B1D|nr:pyridoxamine 5'-phosphate oxidase family protein [Lysinibacillus fusiformis]MDC6268884.1 pyridoxamine 5'-phosphate oxidase family protein [Lysinibacillus sphaericus]MDN4969677.1 pyridoxamine 5'-phosphate oxidase family protein [Lysinibacillus fusiformis]